MIELFEIMRQKDAKEITALLNRIRTASQSQDDVKCLQNISASHDNYPTNALHIWAENKPVDEHNTKQFQNLPAPLLVLKAVDQYPAHVTKQDIDKVLAKGPSGTGGLDYVVLMKEGARVMLTTNIDIADRLINGQMGRTVRIAVDCNTNKPTTVCVKFDDDEAGIIAIDNSTDSYAKQNRICSYCTSVS